ncbi:receptor-like protein 15 isoform X2 [Euphorbia lathyris]|uniref:receptor-like protein 15 isoform X2 n=1 Tax=Euphorbia lathyris TaxID=212925 RepID=UPI003313D9DD
MDKFVVNLLLGSLIVWVQIQGHYGCFEEERLALLHFKAFVHSNSNGADADLLLPSWTTLTSTDCCQWERVTCNSTTAHVIKLSLNDTRLIHFDGYYEDLSIWYLNVSMFQPFKELRILNLSFNAIAEFTHDKKDSERFSQLDKLEDLDLSWNVLGNDVFNTLGKFPALKSLDLHNNFVQGSLSEKDVAALSNLKVLILQFNELNGTLPIHSLVNFSSLEILDLSWNRFTGSIPSNLQHLSSLKALDLSRNYLNGSLTSQGLCQLEQLEELDVSQNSLQGTLPPCLSNLTSLRLLDLSRNQFSRKVSSSLVAALTWLEYIDLSHNNFGGEFYFSSFANHSRLQVVRIVNDNNQFEVETENPIPWVPSFQLKVLVLSNCNLNNLSNSIIPKFLFQQHQLRILDISHNNLQGSLDSLIRNNEKLEFLSLRNNSLAGQLHLPSFRHAQTWWIDLSDNHLCGKIQRNIGQNFPAAIYLNLSKNAFEGRIPSSVADMQYLQHLDMSFNNFTGEVPKNLVSNLTNLVTLKLSGNKLHGQIFSEKFNLTWLEFCHLDNNQFTGSLSEVILRSSELTVLDVSNNNLSGTIPRWIGNLTFLRTLSMRNNQIKGSLPCSLPFQLVDLSYNYLTGPLPPCLELQNINGLYLRANNFTGSLPQSVNVSILLVVLDLRDNSFSGKIPDWISNLPNLEVLLLKGNHLSGAIPNQLCQLNQIEFMDLSNNLLSGSIPPCLYNISFKEAMNYYSFLPYSPTRTIYVYRSILLGQYNVDDSNIGYAYLDGALDFLYKSRPASYQSGILDFKSGLDLSSNNLAGEIPSELGNLYGIHSLNLSRNHLIGTIPRTFSNLSRIESIDLSRNSLNGEIPPELTNLHFLKFFSVAYNNLSGSVPGIKLQSGASDNSSYEGNPFLCGLPLVKSCGNFSTSQ